MDGTQLATLEVDRCRLQASSGIQLGRMVLDLTTEPVAKIKHVLFRSVCVNSYFKRHILLVLARVLVHDSQVTANATLPLKLIGQRSSK